jgi:hypothetical protein
VSRTRWESDREKQAACKGTSDQPALRLAAQSAFEQVLRANRLKPETAVNNAIGAQTTGTTFNSSSASRSILPPYWPASGPLWRKFHASFGSKIETLAFWRTTIVKSTNIMVPKTNESRP